jgi:hypothetical protein
MAEDIAEFEMPPTEASSNEKHDLATSRENDDKPRPKDGPSNEIEGRESMGFLQLGRAGHCC